jgi:chemotaxis protein methyltransferase CheR
MIELADFNIARRLLKQHAGIELNMSKQQMVFNRLIKPMRQLNYPTMGQFLSAVETDPSLQQHFVNALTTNVTSFFREPHHFPILLKHCQNRIPKLRVWSAGCSTGQEAYSILFALLDAFPALTQMKQPIVLATDIDTAALAIAEKACYTATELKNVSEEQAKKYLELQTDGNWQVKAMFRRLIAFKPFNLATYTPAQTLSPWQNFDAIFCRNVMIYFSPEMQRKLVHQFAQYIKPDGLFFSGHAEMLLHSDALFSSVGQTVYSLRRGAGQ